jgi:hypothetical protein
MLKSTRAPLKYIKIHLNVFIEIAMPSKYMEVSSKCMQMFLKYSEIYLEHH